MKACHPGAQFIRQPKLVAQEDLSKFTHIHLILYEYMIGKYIDSQILSDIEP